jgi:RND superfamily putative drug exporter
MALISSGILALLAVGSLFYHASYDMTTALPGQQESTLAYHDLTSAFPAGALNPTQVFVTAPKALSARQLTTLAHALLHTEGVAAVLPPQMSLHDRAAELNLYLKADPYSDAALHDVVGPIRNTAHHTLAGAHVLVGGVTSAYVDVRAAINHDLSIIFPVAGLLIAAILVVLLRSLVAPLYLLGAVALGYTATLGASVGIFQGLGGATGLDFTLPIVVYLFVVAIGTDYNILTTARLREEFAAGHDRHEAVHRTITHGGPTVAAAGIILAGTFASLMLSGIDSMVEMGFAVAVGIALAAFVMASVLVPSIAAILGQRVWWPGLVTARWSRTVAQAAEDARPSLTHLS